MERCLNCGSTDLKDGFIADQQGMVGYVRGKPGFFRQAFGRKSRIRLLICRDCRYLHLFGERERR